jgi:hypothetical protein
LTCLKMFMSICHLLVLRSVFIYRISLTFHGMPKIKNSVKVATPSILYANKIIVTYKICKHFKHHF